MSQPIPVRLQRSRKTGAHLESPNGLPNVYVGRPSRCQNPLNWQDYMREGMNATEARRWAVADFKVALLGGQATVLPTVAEIKERLRGVNVVCWCPLCEKHQSGLPLAENCPDCAPCHGDFLLQIANEAARR